MHSSFWSDIINLGLFISEDFFTFTKSVDPDEMQHYVAFYLGLHCLRKNSLRGFPEYNVLRLFMRVKRI